MRKLLLVLAVLLPAGGVHAQALDEFQAFAPKVVAGGCSAGSFGIDPNAGANPAPSNASGTTTLTTTISTTNCPDEIIVPVISNMSITGVTSLPSHLTFVCRGCAVGSANIGNWVAQSAGALTSEVITVTASGSTFISAGSIAFTGIHAAGPFDTNAAIPNSPGSACAWTTSNANDILFGSQQPSSGTTVVGTGWTTVAAQSSGFMGAAFKSVSATQTALAADGTAFAVTSSVEAACDALIQGP